MIEVTIGNLRKTIWYGWINWLKNSNIPSVWKVLLSTDKKKGIFHEMFQKKTCLTSWWLNHPVIKICNPQNGWRSSPSILRGENSKHIWMKPPPPCGCQPKNRGDWYPQNGWCINFMVPTLWTNGMIWGAKPPIFGNHHPDLNLFFFLLLSKHVLCLVPHVSATGVTRSHPKINLEISKTSRFTRLCSKKTQSFIDFWVTIFINMAQRLKTRWKKSKKNCTHH